MGRILRRPPSTGLKRNCCGNAVFRSSAFIKSGETSEKWDWDYYFECVKRVNESTRHRMEWLERNIPDFTAGRYWGKAVFTDLWDTDTAGPRRRLQESKGVMLQMNYKIEAIETLLNYDCILQRYVSLIPYKSILIRNLRERSCFSKEECADLSDEVLLKMGLPDLEKVCLFRSFLVMYDAKPQKLKEIDKVCGSDEERNSFRELYLLPGVKAVRAKLYYEAGYKYLKDIALASAEQIINDTAAAIQQKKADLKVPLLKEVKTHIAVAKTYTHFKV